MAFDAGMVSAIVNELSEKITGAKIEKVNQPQNDVIVLLLHKDRENLRLLISASSNSPHVNLTSTVPENPKIAPMFCMLLRKHLCGAKITGIEQLGFERAFIIKIAAYDELGFECDKYLITETMGKYSNIILCGKEKKIISALRIIDFATSKKRQILPGMTYEEPPAQSKDDPTAVSRERFMELLETKNVCQKDAFDSFILSSFMGISRLVSAEIAYGAADCEQLWENFDSVMKRVREKEFTPVIIRGEHDKPIEYCYFPIKQYENSARCITVGSFGQLIDEYFGEKDHFELIKQRSSDIFRLLANTENRLIKKTALQKQDIQSCAEKDNYKLWGDLITANIYRLKRGMKSAELENYYADDCPQLEIPLDERLTPAQNAQKYYKKYNKAKKSEVELSKQIELSQKELEYIGTVFDSLTRAENENDLAEIREELYESGYASKMKSYSVRKNTRPKPLELHTTDGRRLLCGKNNSQNDYVTLKIASKSDYWFHVKNAPGSHVIMTSDGDEPTERDFTEAASVAAYYSKVSDGENVPVDYTLVKYIKKPNGSKPGFVIYTTNWTAYVTPDEKLVKRMRTSKPD